MEDYFDQVGGDGFMLSPIYSPGAIEEFVDLVVPELQRRGRYRQDYAGTTQRDHLMQRSDEWKDADQDTGREVRGRCWRVTGE